MTKSQMEVLEQVAQRMCLELEQEGLGKKSEEPLLWCVHGGPGTGKSKVLLLLKELFAKCGWQMGLEYQMAALQAVMAEQLGGDTLHHACGINWRQENADNDTCFSQRASKVAERVSQWKWLIIDEISMVSAKLLAEIDVKLREIMKKSDNMKKNTAGLDRAFGGINVLLVGDFWQLDPPSADF